MSYDPTHVVVSVQRAKDLISKGKNGTNDAFVTIGLADNKFQTTIKDRSIDPEWYEECDVPLPDNYNTHKLIIQVFHRNNLGIDQFLGHLELALSNFDVYDPPKSQWYQLACKPGQDKSNPRGEVEVRLSFEVKKVRDMDSMSVTSSASKRFKMSKKTIKHAAAAIGRKVKGPKNEKTKDYIPDLTDLPQGHLDFEDIAENYSSAPTASKLSLSKTPSSPGFIRNSPRSSKGYSPFTKRKSRGENDTPPSSNASIEDIKQKTDDADSHDGSFLKTHRRGGSGSDAVLKAQKPNRRLLTARPISTSSADVSSTPHNTDTGSVGDRSSMVLLEESTTNVHKPRMRTTTNSSQLSAEFLPEESLSTSHSKRNSTASSKVAEQPVLIDDDSDDMDDYTPSPIVPLVKQQEPDDIFKRMAAQAELEEQDEFNLVKHEVLPGEQVFTPIGKLQSEPTATAHSTPITTSESKENKPVLSQQDVVDDKPPSGAAGGGLKDKKRKDKKKTKPAAAVNVFDLLMASDEPEYNVDDTLPDGRRAKDRINSKEETNPFDEKKEDESNPFAEPKSKNKEQFVSIANQSKLIEEEAADESNPFGSPDTPKVKEPESNPFAEPDPKPSDSNPFESTETTKDKVKSDADMNPFEEPKKAAVAEKSDNPFEEAAQEKAANPFEEESSNPFDEPKTDSKSKDSNPFDEEQKADASNPFEDDDDDEAGGSFNRVGSFARAGSSRFAGSGRNKRQKREKKKAAAPPPPKVETVAAAPPKPERLKPAEDKQPVTATENKAEDRISIKSDYFANSPRNSDPVKVTGAESPRHKYKKERKAPAAPSSGPVSQKISDNTPPAKSRSYSHNTVPEVSGVTKRRDTDPSRMEEHSNIMELGSPSRQERQPAVGAEAPDVPSEPRPTVDAQVQADLINIQENVPSEFRHCSKQDLVDTIQKLRQQVRKKEEHTKDLEEYIDSLLLRVMSADPNLLVASNASCGQQAAQANKLR